jgi:hypothetical protein
MIKQAVGVAQLGVQVPILLPHEVEVRVHLQVEELDYGTKCNLVHTSVMHMITMFKVN